MSREVWLNGQFLPYESATLAIEDRCVQFSESVYEVVRTYRGRPFEMDRHMRRFQASANAIGLALTTDIGELGSQAMELFRRSGLQDALIYFQASSGVAPRSHLRPTGLEPTLAILVMPANPNPASWATLGIAAITAPDDRWARCYVKTTMLLPNTMAKRRAVEAGAEDAIFVRDGFVTEATAANVFAVFDGVLWTPPRSNYILHGITREVILEIAPQLDLRTVEGPVPAERLASAEEIFLSATAFEMAPITTLNGNKIGTGRPGPIVQRIQQALEARALGA